MHSDIIKSVSRLVTEQKHTITSALVNLGRHNKQHQDFFSSSRGQYRQTEPPPSLHTYEHTNTTCDCFCLQELQVIHGRLVTAVRCAPLCGESLYTGTDVEGGGDTVMCVCVCVCVDVGKVWVICRQPQPHLICSEVGCVRRD